MDIYPQRKKRRIVDSSFLFCFYELLPCQRIFQFFKWKANSIMGEIKTALTNTELDFILLIYSY